MLFPKTDVHEAIRKAGDPVNYFWIHEGDGLTALTVETQVFYDLDRTLACRDVNLGNDFKNLHEKFRLEGKVRSVPDDAYRKALGNAILYRQGDAWAPSPRRPRPAPSTAGSSGGPVRGPKTQDQRSLCRPAGGDIRQYGCGLFRSRADDDPPPHGSRPMEMEASPSPARAGAPSGPPPRTACQRTGRRGRPRSRGDRRRPQGCGGRASSSGRRRPPARRAAGRRAGPGPRSRPVPCALFPSDSRSILRAGGRRGRAAGPPGVDLPSRARPSGG